MTGRVRRFFAAAPHRPQLPDSEVQRLYPYFRRTILQATFVGYACFYLVRNNLSPVAKDLADALHYDKSMIGDILAVTAISYGVGKFLMGAVSDRCNPRVFMPTGLLLSAACNFAFGAASDFSVHLFLWGLNGLVQGMGWPPCGRCLGHWYSFRERGLVFAIWNVSHNIGGGVAGFAAAWVAVRWGWSSAFYVPGFVSLVVAVYLFRQLRDTPQSVGLPRIEIYRDDVSAAGPGCGLIERELTMRELLVGQVLANPALWLLAIANFFAYICRYSMLDWGPTYLREVKHADASMGGLAVTVIEFAGIPTTILVGWFSDKLHGRRGMVSFLCILPVVLAFLGIALNPPGHLWFDFLMLVVVGLFVYPLIMLLAVAALDVTSKKAVGAAAGFVGLFGYMGRTAQAKGLGWMSHEYGELYGAERGWSIVVWTIVGCAAITVVLLAFTWNMKPRTLPTHVALEGYNDPHAG